MKILVDLCVAFLELKKPFDICIKSKDNKKASATYTAWLSGKKLVHHTIVIYYGNLANEGRHFETLIAHEFVHAWQAEYKPRSKTHGPVFQNKARELQEFLGHIGIPVGDIYIKGTDK